MRTQRRVKIASVAAKLRLQRMEKELFVLSDGRRVHLDDGFTFIL